MKSLKEMLVFWAIGAPAFLILLTLNVSFHIVLAAGATLMCGVVILKIRKSKRPAERRIQFDEFSERQLNVGKFLLVLSFVSGFCLSIILGSNQIILWGWIAFVGAMPVVILLGLSKLKQEQGV